MRPPAAAVSLLAAVGAGPLAAQAALHVSLGARYSSTLVHDSIVSPVDVRPAVGPALGVALGLPLEGPWRLDLVANLSTAALQRHENGGTSPVTRIWTIGVGVGLRRRLESWLTGRGAIGGLKYLSTGTVGLFSAGTGGVMPFVSLTLDAAPPPLARHGLALQVNTDLHRFITPGLRASGFTDARPVYRVAIGVRARLGTERSP